jgi:hypothetical protein
MEIKVNNQNFKKFFLEQISKISDSGVFVLSNDCLECKTCTPDNSVILGIKFPVKTSEKCDNPQQINVGDIKKLIRAFDCVSGDELSFKLDNNNITYSDQSIKFKFHLLENGIISQPKINLNKLETLEFDCSFTLTMSSLNELTKASTFSTDSNKIYLTSSDGSLKGNLTDKSKYNVDSFEINVANDFTGTNVDGLCLNFEVFRILSSCRYNEMKCKISSKLGVVLFEFGNNIITTKYIVSALTK